MSQQYNTLLFEVDDHRATVTVNRPDKLNALNSEVIDELEAAFLEVNENDDIHGVILTGAGDKAFVAGADIKELSTLDETGGQKVSARGQAVFQSIEDTRKPVIAVVDGYALGGGAELAMACHLRVAGPKAMFGLPEVGLGLIPGYGGTQRLTRIVGHSRALEMILTGKPVKADRARDMGLVNRLTDEGESMDEARKLLGTILGNGPLAVRSAIKAVYEGAEADNGYAVEAETFGYLCSTEDFKEGTGAFLEKRKPEFKGN